MTWCCRPVGYHTPGNPRAEKAITHGTPAQAARCMGPESGPRKTAACSRTAAVSRGFSVPHRFTLAPAHFRAACSLTSASSCAPTSASPYPGNCACSCVSSSCQFSAPVCLLGDRLVQELFTGVDPIGHVVKTGNEEFTVIGTFESIGSVLGQDQDTFMVIPLNTYLRIRGSRNSLTLEVKAAGSQQLFQQAQDDVRVIMRARRHITEGRDEDFYIGTAESYISLWQSISSAFLAVFVMVSSISAVVGGIVIMNVMLVSVTERTKEIGVRRAMGATQHDILMQFLTESVMQCIVGGLIGVFIGFLCALAIRSLTSLPAAVQTWVAILGMVQIPIIGLFFGIYPATKAAKLDPVTALRTE